VFFSCVEIEKQEAHLWRQTSRRDTVLY